MSGSNSGSRSSSSQKESPLAVAQRGILNNREAQYQSYFFPALATEIKSLEARDGEPSGAEARQIGAVSQAFDQQQVQLDRSLEQRGITGGLSALAQTQLATARANSVGAATVAAGENRKSRLTQLVQIGGGMSPTPTTAAPILSRSSSKSRSRSFSMGGSEDATKAAMAIAGA